MIEYQLVSFIVKLYGYWRGEIQEGGERVSYYFQ